MHWRAHSVPTPSSTRSTSRAKRRSRTREGIRVEGDIPAAVTLAAEVGIPAEDTPEEGIQEEGILGGRGGSGGGEEAPSHVDGKKILRQLSEETGGRLFEISKKQTVAQIYNEIAEELRAQYRLGYTPDQATAAEGYHQVDLTAHRKDLIVQTRDGYYAGK